MIKDASFLDQLLDAEMQNESVLNKEKHTTNPTSSRRKTWRVRMRPRQHREYERSCMYSDGSNGGNPYSYPSFDRGLLMCERVSHAHQRLKSGFTISRKMSRTLETHRCWRCWHNARFNEKTG